MTTIEKANKIIQFKRNGKDWLVDVLCMSLPTLNLKLAGKGDFNQLHIDKIDQLYDSLKEHLETEN